MFRLLTGLLVGSSLFPLAGQEVATPSIVGEIRTSVKSSKPQSRVLLNRKIHSSKVIYDQGRTITIYKVDPSSPKPVALKEVAAPQKSRIDQEEAKPSAGFTVFATVLSDNLTRLEWWSHSKRQSKKNVSWSNIGWVNLQGFNTIEDEQRSYTFMLFLSGDSVENFNKRAEEVGENLAPDHLPNFSESGARYTHENEAGISEAGKDFIEAIHALYDGKEAELKKARLVREENRRKYRRELELNPPKKENVVIQFWERDRSKETQTTESE